MSEELNNGLISLLANNVVELRFLRRHKKTGEPIQRRMFCTNAKQVLLSIAGKITLKHRIPKGVGLKYSPSAKGLVVTWDILMQDFRQIPLESVEVIEAHPVRTPEEVDKFWVFFMAKIHDMSPQQKQQFMRK